MSWNRSITQFTNKSKTISIFCLLSDSRWCFFFLPFNYSYQVIYFRNPNGGPRNNPHTTTTSKASSNQLTYWDNVSCEETCICGTEQQHCSREGWWSTETGNASEDGLHESGGRTGWKTRTPKTKWKTRTQEQDGKQELQEQNGKQELREQDGKQELQQELSYTTKWFQTYFFTRAIQLYCTVLYCMPLPSQVFVYACVWWWWWG